MGISELFKKPEEPKPYDWAFLRGVCLEAIDAHMGSADTVKSRLDELDYDRLTVSGDDAEEVVMDIWDVIRDAKSHGLSATQAQEHLFRVGELLRTNICPGEMALRLKEMEGGFQEPRPRGHSKIKRMREASKDWAYHTSRGGLVGFAFSFLAIVLLSDQPYQIWAVRGCFVFFACILFAWSVHYAFIGIDELLRRNYGITFFMMAAIVGFGWVIQSCIRGMIHFK
jgi:hypothetical protein